MVQSMSAKMYKNSPKIVSDENGKKKVQKGPTEAEKKAARVNDGTEGIPITETHDPMKAIDDLHARQATEQKELIKKLRGETMPTPPAGQSGEQEINRITGE